MESPHCLYLSKGDQFVYIDNCDIPQHRIDGIRFLYRLFKKNKPGAIVNDPIGVDKNIQIVLFLKAVCHLLDKTVLVLCPEGTEHIWLELFRTWMDLEDDVVIETAKPYLKKKVIINGMVNLPLFSQQGWSIVVVTSDESSNTVLRYHFKADFKIWNTSVNMKKKLDTFSSIYAWLNQDKVNSKNLKDMFNISNFTPDRNNVKDIIDKAVLLDAFMEDVVIRRTEIDCSSEEIKTFPTLNIVSKKNKDSTGTKAKRSKRKIQDAVAIPVKKRESNESTVPKLPKPNDVGKDDINKLPFEFKPVSSDSLQGQVEEINKNTMNSQDSDIRLVFEADTMTENDKSYKMDTLVDDISSEGGNKEIVHNDNQMECDEKHVLENPKRNELNTIMNSNNAKWRITDIVIKTEDDEFEELDMEDVQVSGDIEKSDGTNHSEELAIANNETIKSSVYVGKKPKVDCMEPEDVLTVVNNEILTHDHATLNLTEVNYNAIKESRDVKEASVQQNLDAIDLKNDQFKEQVMKRFKGSVLDSIF